MFLLIYSIALSSFKSHDKTKQRFVFRLQKIIHRRLTEHHLIPTVCSCCRYQTKNKKLILRSVLLITFFDIIKGPFWFRSWKRTSSSNGTLFPLRFTTYRYFSRAGFSMMIFVVAPVNCVHGRDTSLYYFPSVCERTVQELYFRRNPLYWKSPLIDFGYPLE